jgi:hypothetical protein
MISTPFDDQMNRDTIDVDARRGDPTGVDATTTVRIGFGQWIEIAPLIYLGLPTVIFLCGWVVPAYGLVAALAVAVCIYAFHPTPTGKSPWARRPTTISFVVVASVALVWTVLGGTGHLVFANFDWIVRDAVLSDLVRNSWPVVYDWHSEPGGLLLRAPLGMYMPVALIGKLTSARVADFALMIWIALGVLLTFLLLLRDRPGLRALSIRLAVFVLFSGMDIVGSYVHFFRYGIGEHMEWWAFLFQYSSQTTQLFWAPNHALPAWIVVAWLLGYRNATLPVARAIVMVAFVPFWSPLAAIGLAPLLAVEMFRAVKRTNLREQLREWFDPRVVVCLAVCFGFVYPYLLLGSDTMPSGFLYKVRFVGEDFVPRYIEFVLIEFAGFAALLLWRFRRDGLLLASIAILLLLPTYAFGPANDLAMRSSIPPLTLLAIYLGEWLSERRRGTSDTQLRWVAVVLLAIGAVTPFNEFARLFVLARWPFDAQHNLLEVARREAPHYLTPRDQPWPDRFLRSP